MLDDNYLTIRKWVPNFIPDDKPMRFLTAWVRIPQLSIEYFDKEFLLKIGNKIGKVMRIDQHTTNAERGQFTRLSIEMDLSKPLLSKFWLKGRIWKIQYEGLRLICFNCGKIRHMAENCTLHHEPNPPDEIRGDGQPHRGDAKENDTAKPETEHDFGSWMLVKKPPAKKRGPKPGLGGGIAPKDGGLVPKEGGVTTKTCLKQPGSTRHNDPPPPRQSRGLQIQYSSRECGRGGNQRGYQFEYF